MDDKKKNINTSLDNFLGNTIAVENENDDLLVKTDKSILEKINKKVITEDGRQLL